MGYGWEEHVQKKSYERARERERLWEMGQRGEMSESSYWEQAPGVSVSSEALERIRRREQKESDDY